MQYKFLKMINLDPINFKYIYVYICINLLGLRIDIIKIFFGTSSQNLESF